MFSKLAASGGYAATAGGFGVGFYALSESLMNKWDAWATNVEALSTSIA